MCLIYKLSFIVGMYRKKFATFCAFRYPCGGLGTYPMDKGEQL